MAVFGPRAPPDKFGYEKKIVERFGGQQEFELVVPPPPEMKEATN
jgi:hypothetical protein